MAGKQDISGFVDPALEQDRPRANTHPLRQAAMRLADIGRAGSRLKTKDLIGLLVSHGARAWRTSLPAVDVRVRATTPAGRAAVKIRLH